MANGAVKAAGSRGARLVVLIPYLWLVAFFLVPFLIVLKISLSQTAIAQPPYVPVFDPAAGWEGLKQLVAALSFENYAFIASDWLYLASYLKSLEVAAGATVLLLLVGFPLAYGIARAPRRWQPALFMLVVLPFWTSFLIRIYAWINILQREGLLNRILLALGIVDVPPVGRASRRSSPPCRSRITASSPPTGSISPPISRAWRSPPDRRCCCC